MQLQCNVCGIKASWEAWKITCPACGSPQTARDFDGKDEALLRASLSIPAGMGSMVQAYLNLFRSQKNRTLSHVKAVNLLQELAQLATNSHVQWKDGPARPNQPRYWVEAMDILLNKRNVKSGFSNHNYLRSIAYDLADKADAQVEYALNRAERRGPIRKGSSAEPVNPFGGMTKDEMRRIREENRAKAKKG